MQTQVEAAGALVVSTMDEMMDLVEILVRYPVPPARGPGIVPASGAYGLTNDFAEDARTRNPGIRSRDPGETVSAVLPSYGNYGNPLDSTAGFPPGFAADGGQGRAGRSQHRDAVHLVPDRPGGGRSRRSTRAWRVRQKPKVMVALGDTWPLAADVMAAVEGEPGRVFAIFRSHAARDRALHAIRKIAGAQPGAAREPIKQLPEARPGAATRMAGKEIAGRRRASGAARRTRGRTPDEASAVAGRIGYPVALKAQSATLTHKTEAGGVALNITDERALRAAWESMTASVRRAAPDVALDGILVEEMGPRGVELMIGAKRDPGWGTVLLLGLGGIWVEALGDVKLLPGDADENRDPGSAPQAAVGQAAGRRAGRPAIGRRSGRARGDKHRPPDAERAADRRDRREPVDGSRRGPRGHRPRCIDRVQPGMTGRAP